MMPDMKSFVLCSIRYYSTIGDAGKEKMYILHNFIRKKANFCIKLLIN